MLKKRNITYKKGIEIILYALVFLYCIFLDAIYSPDTPSYINANIYRSPGYPIFTRSIQIVFQGYFNFFIVLIQALLGLFAVYTISSKVRKILELNYVLHLIFLVLLLFPFFSPLQVANNISSEGLSYPLYLFFLSFSLDFIILNTKKSLIYIIICSIFLALTRGQFLILPFVLAILYIFKYKRTVFNRFHLTRFILLLIIPFISILVDKSYHKIKDGLFISTPFTYINAAASALYISKAEDVNSLENEDYKHIFNDCYSFISKNKWLLSSEERMSNAEDYKHFHRNLGKICNLTLHEQGTAYFLNKNNTIVEARYYTEQAAKAMFPILVKNNFKEWICLFYSNLIYGFKLPILFIFVLFAMLFSAFKAIKVSNKNVYIILFLSALILSNALVVAFASHSIMRYLFYNYSLFFLILVSIFKYINHVREN